MNVSIHRHAHLWAVLAVVYICTFLFLVFSHDRTMIADGLSRFNGRTVLAILVCAGPIIVPISYFVDKATPLTPSLITWAVWPFFWHVLVIPGLVQDFNSLIDWLLRGSALACVICLVDLAVACTGSIKRRPLDYVSSAIVAVCSLLYIMLLTYPYGITITL